MTIQEIEQLRKKCIVLAPISLLYLFISWYVGITIATFSNQSSLYTLLGILIPFSGIVFIVYTAVIGSRYITTFKTTYLKTVAAQYLPEFTYNHISKTSKEEFKKSKLISDNFNIFKTEDHLTSEFYGRVDIHNVSIQKQVYTSKNNHITTLFTGLFVEATFPFDFDGQTYLKPKYGSYAYPTHGLEKVTLESVRFNEIWDVYSDNQIGARLALRTDIMNNLLYLKEELKTDIWMRFAHSKLYIGIKDDSFLEPPFFTPITSEKYTGKLKKELESIISIIETFKLSQN